MSRAGTIALLRHRPFLLSLWSRSLSELSHEIAAVAIGWQIYSMTDSAFALGMVGLAQFVPAALSSFAAGHAADRYDRRIVTGICQTAEGLIVALLAWGSFAGWLTAPAIFASVAGLAVAATFEDPASSALLPSVVPEGALPRAAALSSGTFQIASITGPAIGGLAYAAGPAAAYAGVAALWLLSALFTTMIETVRVAEAPEERPSLSTLFAGVGFVRRNPAILGTISLDLFVVLLGGATALLPIYARDILGTGPWGLGVLKSAPAVGALLMAAMLARVPLDRRVGMRMFQAVIVFGLATIVFALSRSLVLSVVALAVLGAADMVSMVIRIALVQLATPNSMRGRVGAVNFLFINASNQLGDFESGVAAALFGAVPAAALGGIGTVAVALLWMWLFPSLRDVERLEPNEAPG